MQVRSDVVIFEGTWLCSKQRTGISTLFLPNVKDHLQVSKHLQKRRFPAAIDSHKAQLLPPAHRKLKILELKTSAIEGVAETLRDQHLRRACHNLFVCVFAKERVEASGR